MIKEGIYRVIIIAVFACMVVTLFSCSLGKKEISITSTYDGLNKLIEGEIDIDRLNDWIYIDDNPYYSYECAVSVYDGTLHVSEIEDDSYRQYMFAGDNGYFMGVSIGHFDGWVRYYPYNSAFTSTESKLICTSNCVGMVKRDNRHGYFITPDTSSEGGRGIIYELTLSDTSSEWECSELLSIDGAPEAMAYDEESNELVVASNTGLYLIDIDSDELTSISLTVPSQEIWSIMQPNSVAMIDEFIYVGTSTGVYEYDRNTSVYRWYPVDFSVHL